jgi:hypothetical protein
MAERLNPADGMPLLPKPFSSLCLSSLGLWSLGL